MGSVLWCFLGVAFDGNERQQPTRYTSRNTFQSRIVVARIGSILDKQSDKQSTQAQQSNHPPELDWPGLVADDEPRECVGERDAEDSAGSVEGEAFASLVQEEHVHDKATAECSRECSKCAGQPARDAERNVVVLTRHERGPDVAKHGSDQTPEDYW